MDAAGQSTPGRIGLVSADAASSTGRWIVTNVANGPAEIRDARTLALRQTIAGRADSIALSPDDRTLLVGGHDGSVRFVDLPSGEARSFPGHESAVVAAAFSRDGRSAATGGRDNRIQTWDVRRGTVRETLTGHTAQVVGLAFSRDGRTLYSAGSDGKPLIWDLTGVRRLGRSVALRPDLRPDPIPIAGYAGTLANYDASPDGRTFAVGEEDGTVRLVDTRTLRPRMAIRALSGHLASVGYLSNRTLLVTDETGSAVFVDPVTGAVGRRHDGFGAPSKPSLSRDARLMATQHWGRGRAPDPERRAPVRQPPVLRDLRHERGIEPGRADDRGDRCRGRGDRRRRDTAPAHPAPGHPARVDHAAIHSRRPLRRRRQHRRVGAAVVHRHLATRVAPAGGADRPGDVRGRQPGQPDARRGRQ
jgi:hypothetical protein